jgi:hypothetical protein
MGIEKVLKLSFFAGAITTFIGAYLKITHTAGAENFLLIGILASVIFIATAIYEVQNSKRINHREKTMWTIAFLFFNGFTGLIYFFIGRRRVA